jgi:thiamine phosphate synthase YjbQ (UPF0047 family)
MQWGGGVFVVLGGELQVDMSAMTNCPLRAGIALFDITPQIREQVQQLGVKEGFVNVLSRHTTTAVAINEYETRLLDDIRQVTQNHAQSYSPA